MIITSTTEKHNSNDTPNNHFKCQNTYDYIEASNILPS